MLGPPPAMQEAGMKLLVPGFDLAQAWLCGLLVLLLTDFQIHRNPLKNSAWTT